MKSYMVDRDGKITEEAVPGREWCGDSPVIRYDGVHPREFRAQLWRHERDKSTDVVIYVERGAPQDRVHEAVRRAMIRSGIVPPSNLSDKDREKPE